MQDEVDKVVRVLQSGGTILYPTDTVWGLGCDATNPKAVDKIYRIKKRIEDKSLIILVDSVHRINDYVKTVDPVMLDLVENYNKPLTVIYPGAKNLAKRVMTADKTIGIRVVKDEFIQKLIAKFGKAITSTSANLSGFPMPIHFQQISEEIKSSVDYVVGLYHYRIRDMKPSRIIKVKEKGDFEIIRP